jgi:hypothetical protein
MYINNMKQNILKRVWQEVKEVNADFFNLRTVISPDLVGDNATRFFFMMLPNDGAMAHLTLVGTFYIPEVSSHFPTIHRVLRPVPFRTLTCCSRLSNIPSHRQLCSYIHPRDDIMSMSTDMCFQIRHYAALCVLISFDHRLMEVLGSQSTPSPPCSHL